MSLVHGKLASSADQSTAPLLELKGVTKRFGGLKAVDSVDLAVRPREIVSIIGPNGAGKTTLFNLITGIYQPTSGEILFEGKPLTGSTFDKVEVSRPKRSVVIIISRLPLIGYILILLVTLLLTLFELLSRLFDRMTTDKIVRCGITRTFQNIRLFNNMTVMENVLVGMHTQLKTGLFGTLFRPPSVQREEAEARHRALELLGFFGTELVERQEEYVINLSYAQRRRVEIARALAAKPKLLLLDEPTAGMNDTETLEAVKYIRRLRDELGLTILLIEHKLAVTMSMSDHIAVLDYGRKIADGSPEEVRNDERVIAAYLGKPTRNAQADPDKTQELHPRKRPRTEADPDQTQVLYPRPKLRKPRLYKPLL